MQDKKMQGHARSWRESHGSIMKSVQLHKCNVGIGSWIKITECLDNHYYSLDYLYQLFLKDRPNVTRLFVRLCRHQSEYSLAYRLLKISHFRGLDCKRRLKASTWKLLLIPSLTVLGSPEKTTIPSWSSYLHSLILHFQQGYAWKVFLPLGKNTSNNCAIWFKNNVILDKVFMYLYTIAESVWRHQ